MRLSKQIEEVELISKNKKGIQGLFKTSKSNYEYSFIENPNIQPNFT